MRHLTSSSSISFSFAYDVFLSFRGSDTRYGFTGNLHEALSRKGIRTFIDDEDLQKGEEITPTLLKAIEESRIAIVVFSENYASSTFCLKELVKILECVKRRNRLVWPVFYDVDPSDLRHIKGSYGEAMKKHEARFKHDKEKVNKWKLALQEAANLSGSHFQPGIEYERKFIEEIVGKISRRTSRIILPVADYPVGLESRVQEVNSLLDVSSKGVIMVGIYGIGGIGKSTTARAIYNLIMDQFESTCFLEDVRGNSTKKGLVELQETMLSKIAGEKNIKLSGVYEGISIIKNRFSRKKILLILDNVNELDQLKKLAGELDWFGPGSRVIITTRDKHLLHIHKVERKCEMKTLSHKEAHELFTWNAFKAEEFDPSYIEDLESLKIYCSGIPLALEIMGRHLSGRTPEQWKSALLAYENVPKKDIQQILKASYDDLGDFERQIFLDIACFLEGYKLENVKNIWSKGCDTLLEAGIEALMDRSLIKIDSDHNVSMHDLIQDMGKEIVRKESPLEPGKRSRLWSYKDILHIFEENMGTNNIEAIVLQSSKHIKVQWNGTALKKMKNLRILIIRNVSFSGGPKYLPNSLKYFHWEEYPSSTLPFDNPKELRVLNLKGNCLTSFKSLPNFKFLDQINLEDSEFLVRAPDLSGASNLRDLNLDYCTNLIEVHTSVGNLDKLGSLTARNCTNLKIFPEALKSTSIVSLDLARCSSLGSDLVMLGIMEKISELHLLNFGGWFYYTETSTGKFWLVIGPHMLSKLEKIKEHHKRMRRLEISGSNFPIANHSTWLPCCSSLEELDVFCRIHECLFTWLPFFSNVEVLRMKGQRSDKVILAWHPTLTNPSFVQRYNNFADEFVLRCLRWMPNLRELSIWGMDFTVLPECINECHFLRRLTLNYCKQLQEIRGMPPNIEYLSAEGCISLSTESRSLLLSQTLHEAGNKEFVLPGKRIPEWFDYRQSTATSLTFWVRNKFPERIIFGFVYTGGFHYDLLVDGTRCSNINKFHLLQKGRQICLLHVRIGGEELQRDRWTQIECCKSNLYTMNIVGCMGVHVYDKGKNSREDVRFTDPNSGKSKVDENMGDANPNYRPLLKNWRTFPNMKFLGIHFPYRYFGKIWKMQALPKVKILIWRIEEKWLPTYGNLFSKQLIRSPLCPICEADYETIEHAFLHCPWTRVVWFGSGLKINASPFLTIRGLFEHGWLARNVGGGYEKNYGIIGNICWAIWKGRNEYILEDKLVDPVLALLRVEALYNQYSHSDPLIQRIKSEPFSEITYQGQVKGSGDKGKGKKILMAPWDTNTEEEEGHSEFSWDDTGSLDSIITDSDDDEGEGTSYTLHPMIYTLYPMVYKGTNYTLDLDPMILDYGSDDEEWTLPFTAGREGVTLWYDAELYHSEQKEELHLGRTMLDPIIHNRKVKASEDKGEGASCDTNTKGNITGHIELSSDDTKGWDSIITYPINDKEEPTSYTLDPMMIESTIHNKEGTSYPSDSMTLDFGSDDEEGTSYTLDPMMLESAIHNRKRKRQVTFESDDVRLYHSQQ